MAETETPEYVLEDGVTLDGDTKIEVVDDTPEVDKGRAPMAAPPAAVTDDELTKYSDHRLKARLTSLNKGYHDERRAKEAATRERDEAIRFAQNAAAENQRLQGSLANNQGVLIDQAKKVVSADIDNAKRQYREAHKAFDADGMVAAQEALTAATIRAERINTYRPPPVQAPQTVVQHPPVQQPVPVDAKTRAWQDENPWFGNNRKMTAYALSLHEDLIEAGVPVSSDDYFAKINADVKERFPEAFEGEPAGATKSQRSRSNVAPVSRSTAAKKIVLTQTQVNLAKRLGLPLEVYARSVAELNRT